MNPTNEIPKKSQVTPWQEMDEQVLVLMPKKNTVHELNTTASFLWKNINGTNSIETLVELLVEEFDVDAETAKKDVALFISEMKAQGLIECH